MRRKKKVKTRPYSILIKKSKGSSAFNEQKVKKIAIEYRLQSIFPNREHRYMLDRVSNCLAYVAGDDS